jgi:L-threonylcarbamoyladenylate synthase
MNTYTTQVWNVDSLVDNEGGYPQIQEAAKLINQDEVIAFPTETVYGLGASAFSSQAVQKIFQAKGRPSDNPLIVHISQYAQLDRLVTSIPVKADKLMDAFWPGPLTLILPKKAGIAPEVTAGLDTVGVRMPDHPVALALIGQADTPLAAPSANRSGRPSPTTAAHVYEDLQGRIAGLIDGGPTGVGVESTVVDLTVDPPVILRPGGVTKEEIEQVIGSVSVDPGLLSSEQQPKSPGMKYRHYAPMGEMWIIQTISVDNQVQAINKLIAEARKANRSHRKIGVLATTETRDRYPQADVTLACGSRDNLSSVAHHLYEVLRSFDELGVDYILAESFPEEGVGMAIMNRLLKAAGNRVCQA